MGVLVYVLGRTGTGKSYSMRNFPKDKLAVLNVQGKILPFKGSAAIEQTSTDDSDKIVKALKIYSKDYKSIVVDDYQYLMSNEFMRRATERGYDKFTEIARHAWDIANEVRSLPADVIVYIMCHTDTDAEGIERLKTIGKLLDEKIYLEGMSTIVLKTNVSDGKYAFLTQNSGKDTVKSPADMFPSYAIDNDLWYVDQKIREYYGLSGLTLSEEDIKEIDEAAKKEDVPFTGGKKERKKRGKAKEEVVTEAPAEEKKEEKADAAGADESAEEQPKKRRRRSVTNSEERAEVQQENAEIIANANTTEDGEGVPFEEAEPVEIKDPPKRKRRTKAEMAEAAETPTTEDKPDKEDEAVETAMNPPAEDVETPEAPKRRRRRRSSAE